jgi:hypothetical protein
MPQRHPTLLALLALALGSSLSGCAWMRNCIGGRPAMPAPCVIASDASKEDIVAYLNENTAKVTAWKTDRANISIRGQTPFPLSVGANIFVEAPRNFRLIASSLVGREADLGSNHEHFWFWNKHNEEKYVFRARHDEDPEKMRRVPIPFQPDWIIEALGVISIDPEEVTMQPGRPGTSTVLLTADKVSPQGFKIRKVIVVDTCRGVIIEHAVYDARSSSRLIARAELKGHTRDVKSQAVLPTQINLDWPDAQLGMTLSLPQIEVNPTRIPPQTWAIQPIEGYTVYELGQ